MLLGAFSRVCDGSVEDAGPWTQTHIQKARASPLVLDVQCGHRGEKEQKRDENQTLSIHSLFSLSHIYI